MNKKFEVEAAIRNKKGKSVSRRLRLDEKVPGVVYGGGKEPMSLTIDHNKLVNSLDNEAFYSTIITLKTDSETERVILKDIQRHPYKPKILHIDFQRVRADEKLYMHVPIHFTGEEVAPGVKDAGGLVSHIMTDVEISCFPDDLPEYIEADISQMNLNDLLHLSDLKLPKGVELVDLTHGNDKPVVSIHMPKVEEEPVVEPTEAPTAAEVPATAQKGEPEGGETQSKESSKESKEKK